MKGFQGIYLRPVIENLYSLVPNRRGGWNKRGDWKNLQNIISGWGGIAGGGLEMMQQFSHVFFFVLLKRRLQKLNVLCYVVNEIYDMKWI